MTILNPGQANLNLFGLEVIINEVDPAIKNFLKDRFDPTNIEVFIDKSFGVALVECAKMFNQTLPDIDKA